MENGGLVCNVQTNGFKDGLNGDKVCFNKEKQLVQVITLL